MCDRYDLSRERFQRQNCSHLESCREAQAMYAHESGVECLCAVGQTHVASGSLDGVVIICRIPWVGNQIVGTRVVKCTGHKR